MRKSERFVAVFDTHGDMIDQGAAKAFWEFVRFWKPTRRIHGGDAFDLRALRMGASDEEKAEGMKADVEAGLDFLKKLDPEAITLGNHDWRLWRSAAGHGNGVIRTYCSQLIDAIHDALPQTQFLEYCKRKGVYRLGHLKVIHGYHNGLTAAKRAAEIYGAVILGHGHAIDHYAIPALEPRMGRMCGCLCLLDMDYNRAQANTLRQAHGWAYGFIHPDGTYTIFQAQRIGDSWWFPTEFREVKAA